MSSQLKISADTSEVKKSILDIGKSMRDLKGSKVQVFSNEDKKFIKTEMKKEMALMKQKLKENREEISRMVSAQRDMVQGSKQELEQRKKILESYKIQAKLAKQLGSTQKAAKSGGDLDQAGGGLMGGLLKFAKMIPGIAAVATIGYGVSKGMAANNQYVAGSGNRNRLKGLGVGDESFGSASDLARVGLTEQDMIQRRIDATSTLGRGGTSNQTEMQKAAFERAYGLEGGSMTGIASSLRGQMGGSGANDAQLKLQASVFASGLEDAIGPYLESAVNLLTQINDSGMNNTTEMINVLSQLTKGGQRTPEQLAKMFGGIDSSVKGASGEQSAFLQAAFARAGIGGGTIGGTKFAMSSGGIMGLNQDELSKRGYNPELLKNMDSSGMFSGMGKRTGAIMDMMRQSGGLKAGQSISGISNTDQMVGINNLSNSIFGTTGNQGFDAALMMEQVQGGKMSQESFDKKLQEMKEGSDPSVKRLTDINNTLAGQTEILRNIHVNLAEALGKEAVQAGNQIVRTDNEGIKGLTNVGGAINNSGFTKGAGDVSAGIGSSINSGALGGALHDFGGQNRIQQKRNEMMMSEQGIINFAKKRRDAGTGFQGMTDDQIEAKVKASLSKSAKEIGKAIGESVNINNKVNNNIKVLPTGPNPTNRTTK